MLQDWKKYVVMPAFFYLSNFYSPFQDILYGMAVNYFLNIIIFKTCFKDKLCFYFHILFCIIVFIFKVFHLIDCHSIENETDRRFEYFINKVLLYKLYLYAYGNNWSFKTDGVFMTKCICITMLFAMCCI